MDKMYFESFVTKFKKQFSETEFSLTDAQPACLCQTSFPKALWLIFLAHHQFSKLKAFIYWSFFVGHSQTQNYFNYANRQVVNTFGESGNNVRKIFSSSSVEDEFLRFMASTFFYDYAISFTLDDLFSRHFKRCRHVV